jgi:erythromycin esterase
MTGAQDDQEPSDVEAVSRWIVENAHPLTTVDPHAPLIDLEPLVDMVGDARVVGLGRPTHGAHELSTLSHRVVRLLVERLGFRSLALEETWTTGVAIDEHLRTGRGNLRALIDAASHHHQTEELLDVLRWIRSHNEQHPSDLVRFVGLEISSHELAVLHAQAIADVYELHAFDAMTSMSDVESCLAKNTIWWHEHTGHKVVYWSGSHSAVGHARTVSFPPATPKTSRNAGSYLRDHFGARYVSAGLSFHHGSVPDSVPAPTPGPGRVDAVLGSTDLPSYVLDLHAAQPDPTRSGPGSTRQRRCDWSGPTTSPTTTPTTT